MAKLSSCSSVTLILGQAVAIVKFIGKFLSNFGFYLMCNISQINITMSDNNQCWIQADEVKSYQKAIPTSCPQAIEQKT